jgi:hypothetical protein
LEKKKQKITKEENSHQTSKVGKVLGKLEWPSSPHTPEKADQARQS